MKDIKDTKETKSFKGSTAGKVRKLQKQYNKILVDLFDQFASECIESALDKNEGSFGENIHGIVSDALDELKTKVLGELGVSVGSGEMSVLSIAGIGSPGIEGIDDETEEGETEDGSEEGMELADYGDVKDEDEDDEDKDEDEDEAESEELSEESFRTDKRLSHARKGDQLLLSEAYSQMYRKK